MKESKFLLKLREVLYHLEVVWGKNSSCLNSMKEKLRIYGITAIMKVLETGDVSYEDFEELRQIGIPEELLESLFVASRNDYPFVLIDIYANGLEDEEVFYKALPLLSRKEVDIAILHYLNPPDVCEKVPEGGSKFSGVFQGVFQAVRGVFSE